MAFTLSQIPLRWLVLSWFEAGRRQVRSWLVTSFEPDTDAQGTEHQQPLYMCFVDFKKAFDSIFYDKFWVTMMDMGYPLSSQNALLSVSLFHP